MPALQVVKMENGEKGVAPMELGGFGGGSGGTVDTVARADAAQALTLAQAALPKSGGELAGNLILGSDNPAFMLKHSELDIAAINPESAAYKTLRYGFADKNNQQFGNLYSFAYENGALALCMRLVPNSGFANRADLRLDIDKNGQAYASAPPPRTNNYGNDVLTMKAMRDNTLYYLPSDVQLHINALTGSDTADLFAGRGFSADKAFQSFDGLMSWLVHCAANYVTVIIDNDTVWNGMVGTVNIGLITVMSLDTSNIKTLTVTGSQAFVRKGSIRFQNIKLQANGNSHIVKADGGFNAPIIYLGQNVELAGSVTGATVIASQNAVVEVGYKPAGEVTGKRYQAVNGSKILVSGGGADYIPGTVNGTVDATSIYG